jgi:Ca2+-binding EF-hand superfamily protein
MTFDDFLDMLNVFSENAPRDLKVYYAFKIYGEYIFGLNSGFTIYFDSLRSDYDGDHFITAYDIEQTTIALTRNELTPDEIQDVCDRVIEEANNDDDGVVSLAEFQAVISRSPDFLR